MSSLGREDEMVLCIGSLSRPKAKLLPNLYLAMLPGMKSQDVLLIKQLSIDAMIKR